MKALRFVLPLVATMSVSAQAQHLAWTGAGDGNPVKPATCLYGEIEVLATGPTIYYCGCNWWPGAPAGGYCGIQDADNGRHLMIFSIWDTSADLHPTTVEHEARTQYNRFGGEGTGAHTHLDYAWPMKKTFRYFVHKVQDATKSNTLTKMYFYDEGLHKWVHEATISNPNNGNRSVETFGGYLNAFLENWSGQSREIPKLALYRLWIGDSPDKMINLCEVRGDAKWGILGDDFYLAEGDDTALTKIFAATGKKQIVGSADRKPLAVKSRTIDRRVVRQLAKLAE